jgi:hypothetical protein
VGRERKSRMALGWPPGASYGVPFPRRPVATECSLVSRAAIISRWSKSSRSRSQHRVHSQGDCPQPCKANAADGGRPGHKAVSMTVPPGGGSPFGPWNRHGASHYASGFYFSRCISPSASAQIRNVFAAASPYSCPEARLNTPHTSATVCRRICERRWQLHPMYAP